MLLKTRFYWVLPSFFKYQVIKDDSQRRYRVLPSFSRFSFSVRTGFYRVLPSFRVIPRYQKRPIKIKEMFSNQRQVLLGFTEFQYNFQIHIEKCWLEHALATFHFLSAHSNCCYRVLPSFRGSPCWFEVVFTGFYRVLPSFTRFCQSKSNRIRVLTSNWILPSFPKFYRVLTSFSKFYWVLPSFTGCKSISIRVVAGFTGFYRVLPSFSEFCRVRTSLSKFYRVLPSFTEFYRVLPSFGSGL